MKNLQIKLPNEIAEYLECIPEEDISEMIAILVEGAIKRRTVLEEVQEQKQPFSMDATNIIDAVKEMLDNVSIQQVVSDVTPIQEAVQPQPQPFKVEVATSIEEEYDIDMDDLDDGDAFLLDMCR